MTFPTDIPSLPRPTSSTLMNDTGFEGDVVIDALADNIEAGLTKTGTGASTPTLGKVMTGTGVGTSAWQDPAVSAADLTGHTGATGTSVHGLGTMSTQVASAVAITGGTINGATVGATTPAFVGATVFGSSSESLSCTDVATTQSNAASLSANVSIHYLTGGQDFPPWGFKLPAATSGRIHLLCNGASSSLSIWPAIGTDTINTSGNNATAFTLPGKCMVVFAATDAFSGAGAGTFWLTSHPATLPAAWFPALTGDVTTTAGALATTIAAASVTLAKMANIATDKLIGRDTAGTGVPEAISVGGGVEFSGSTSIQRSALTGDVTAPAGSNATTIAANAVTFAKMATQADQTIVGNNTGGTAVPLALTAAQVRTLLALVIGTNVQAWDADLDAIAALTSAADKMPYSTGAQAWALATLTAAGRALIDDADADAQLATLGGATPEGTGAVVRKGSPTLTTPDVGVATATSVNKVAITAPASSATLTIANGKTLTASNSLTLAGTDSTTHTFPSTTSTLARTDAGQTFTGVNTFTSPAITTPTGILLSDIAPTMGTLIDFREDFFGPSTGVGNTSFQTAVTGTSAAVAANVTKVDNNHWGIVRINPGTDTTGVACIHNGSIVPTSILGAGLFDCELLLQLSALSDATNAYTLWAGFGDTTTSTENAMQIGFKYTHSLDSGNWQGITATTTGAQTLVSSTDIAVAAGSWVKLRFTDDGTTSTFYVNGTSIGTSTTNRPTGAVAPNIKILKSAGATQPLVYVDYFQFRKVVSR